MDLNNEFTGIIYYDICIHQKFFEGKLIGLNEGDKIERAEEVRS